jgi:cholesterol transport system auxiliary component
MRLSVQLFLAVLAPMLISQESSAQSHEAVQANEVARYDFGRLSGPWNFSAFPLASIDVKAVPWLDNPTMQIRLEFEDKWRRRSYAESQWVAPPAELLQRFLTRRILFRQSDQYGRGCHLSFFLHELGQSFEKQDSSSVSLEMLASLLPINGGRTLAKRAFLIIKKAPTPDAVGNVAATREAVQTLSSEIDIWLTEIQQESPSIANYCNRVGDIKALKPNPAFKRSVVKMSAKPA